VQGVNRKSRVRLTCQGWL